jgi:hypothetical protein
MVWNTLWDVPDKERWYLFFVGVRDYLAYDISSSKLCRCDFDYLQISYTCMFVAPLSLYPPISWETLPLQMQYHFVTWRTSNITAVLKHGHFAATKFYGFLHSFLLACMCVKFSHVVRLQHFASAHFDQNYPCQILPSKQTFTLLMAFNDKFDSLRYMRHCSKSHATCLCCLLFTFCSSVNWAITARNCYCTSIILYLVSDVIYQTHTKATLVVRS